LGFLYPTHHLALVPFIYAGQAPDPALLMNELFAEEWNTTQHSFITGIVAIANEDLDPID
jgi:hypothetical protein